MKECCYCNKPLGTDLEWLNKPYWEKYKFACEECRTRRIKEIQKRKSTKQTGGKINGNTKKLA